MLVAGKPVNVTAKWICSYDVLVTWSPPVDNDPFIAGYEVFYSVSDWNFKTFSVGVTNDTFLIISVLFSAQNYSFFVMTYLDEEHTLPGNLSNILCYKFILLKLIHFIHYQVNEVTPSSVNGVSLI